MREAELRAAAECGVCERKIGAARVPLFWRLTIEQHGVLQRPLERQAALETLVGNVQIAQALSPGEDMTTVLFPSATITVCAECALRPLVVHEIAERVTEARERAAGHAELVEKALPADPRAALERDGILP